MSELAAWHQADTDIQDMLGPILAAQRHAAEMRRQVEAMQRELRRPSGGLLHGDIRGLRKDLRRHHAALREELRTLAAQRARVEAARGMLVTAFVALHRPANAAFPVCQ